MNQNFKTLATDSFLNFLYFLIPAAQLMLSLRTFNRKMTESPTASPLSGENAELRKKNVMYKLVIGFAGLALSACIRHIAMTKSKDNPQTLKDQGDHYA